MKILILGSGGPFGTNLARFCLSQGIEVMGITRTQKPECFSLGIQYPIHYYHLGYEQDYALKVIANFNPDYIVNFAAQGEAAACWNEDNWRYYQTNCTDLVRLVSRVSGHFIQIGSSEVYGPVAYPVCETHPINPTSPYAVSKAAFDLHLIAMHHSNGLPVIVMRPSNCFSPGQQLHRIIPKTLLTALKGGKLPLHGGGIARKSYLHATDLSRAILTVIQSGSIGEVYNVGPDDPTPIREIVERCLAVIKVSWDSVVQIAPERIGQDSCYWLNSSKIKALGWKQSIEWDQGLNSMVDWIRNYPELLSMPTDFVMRA